VQVVSDSQERLEALRKLLKEGSESTQDELRERLEKLEFQVTQSTISRDLRKLGAIKVLDPEGRTIYKLPEEDFAPVVVQALGPMVRDISHNSSMLVIHTTVGSASLVARHLDHTRPAGILGTIAGDDTIFVAVDERKSMNATIRAVRQAIGFTQ